MMYSAYKLNKQGNNIQPWCTPFSILNQSVVQCLVLTVTSCLAYKFLRRQVRWSDTPIYLRNFQFVGIHTVKGFSAVNEAEMDVLECPCFFCNPTYAGNLISGSSAFSKFRKSFSKSYIYKFSVHVLLKPSLKDFEHDSASMWNERNCMVVWTFFGIALFWDWNENWPFPVLWPLLSFLNLLTYWMGFPGSSDGNESACNAGDLGSIPGSGRSPGEGNGNPLQYSWLENSMDTKASSLSTHHQPHLPALQSEAALKLGGWGL